MFFTYNQNNPDGRFNVTDEYGHCLCVEADTPDDANRRAEAIVGPSFDIRWDVKWREDQGTEKPKYYEEWPLLSLEKYFTEEMSFPSLYDIFVVDVYYKNGKRKRKKYNVAKLYEKGEKARRATADKLWGTCVNLSGLYHDKPVRVYKNKELDSYYDRAGNFSIPGPGLNLTDYGCVYFASSDKKDVEEFIAGAKSMQSILTDCADKELKRIKGETPKRSGAEAVVTMFKQWTGKEE